MSMRSRTDHTIPSDVNYSATIGGRREIKYIPFTAISDGSVASSITEGSSETVSFTTNLGDGSYNFVVTPTARITTPTGTFTVSSGAGTFSVEAVTNAVREADTTGVIRISNIANDTLLVTLSTDLIDDSPITQPAVGFVEAVAKGDTWKYEDSNTDLGTDWRYSTYDDSGWSSGVGQLGFGNDGESTVLTSGAPTYYFRKTITLDDADTYDEYDIDVTYDDGFIFYINGVIVADANMNTTSYSHTSLATATVTNNAQYTATIPSSAFNDGVNILACEVHQASTGSSDLGWDAGLSAREIADYALTGPATLSEGDAAGTYTLSLKDGVSDGTFFLRPDGSGEFVETEQSITTSSGTGTTTFSAAPDLDFTEGNVLVNLQLWTATGGSGTFLQSISTTVVDIDPSSDGPTPGTYEQFAFDDTWKYYDLGTDPGAYTETTYDDSAWSSGAGELGFGDGDETTTISDVNQISNQFRKVINVTDGDQYEEYMYDILYDDGVVLYINGDEQARSSNMTATPAVYNTAATGTISDTARLTGTLPASAFVDGNNTIAVLISQNSATSSDVSFNMGLSTVKLSTYYTLDGDSSVIEGNTANYTVATNAGNDTYYYSVSPTTHFVETDGSFSVTGGVFGTGAFTLSAKPDGTVGSNDVTISLRTDSTSGTVRDTTVTSVLEAGGPVAGYAAYQQGTDSYAGTTDTYVQSGSNESTGRGGSITITVDKNSTNERFGFIKFDDIENTFTDTTAVTVVSAGMTVTISSEGQGVRIYKLLTAFTEATTYSTIGSLLTNGTGYTGNSAMSIPDVVLDANNFTGETTFEIDAATVENWIKTPADNHGMVFIADHSSDGLGFRSSEQGTVSQRPTLTIAYTE